MLINRLRRWGAANVAHSGSGFLDHLVGTYRITTNWGLDRRVRLAALFHAVYGVAMQAERVASGLPRDDLRAIIGDEAEELVWCFFTFDREKFFTALEERNEVPDMTQQRTDDLVHLLAANQLEQIPRTPELTHSTRIGPLLTLVPLLRQKARADILKSLECSLENRPGSLLRDRIGIR